MAKVEFLSPGSNTLWTVPENVTSIIIECYGGGAAGGSVSNLNASTGGGGGGCYVKKTLNVTPGQVLRVTVADYAEPLVDSVSNGIPSRVDNNGATVYANAPGGLGGDINLAGSGNDLGAIGDFIYKGGNGVYKSTSPTGGGGACGSKYGVGSNALNAIGGLGQDDYSGDGANGASWSAYTNGNDGIQYGGGGSGAKATSTTTGMGGRGASGAVIITYEVPNQNHFFLL